jgi:cobalt-zinc-cadmium efflux system outer membrane protein
MNRRFRSLLPIWSLVSLALLATGCTSTDPGPALAKVRQTVASRIGQDLPLSQEHAQVQEMVSQLLTTNLSAENAVRIALLNSPALQATLQEVGVAQAELVQAGLLRNPRFSASWRFPSSPPSGMNSEYSIAQDFVDLALLPLRKKLAAQSLEQAQLRVSTEILQLIAEVQKAFFTIQAREQLLGRIRLVSEVNEASADLAQRQHEAGNISDLDLANQKAVYAESRVLAAFTQSELRTDRERLNRLLGLWGRQTAWKVGTELPPMPDKEMGLEHLESAAIRQRFDLAAARNQVNSLGFALSLRTKTRFLPASIEVGVDTEREPDGQRVSGPTLDLELPIFDQGQAAIARMMAQYKQAARAFEGKAINIRSEVREARDKLIASRDLAEYYQKVLLPLRIQIVNQTLLQYNAMQKPAYELLSAKERELDAERNYIEAWRDYWIARSELARAMGGGLIPIPSTVNTDSYAPKADHLPHQH